MGTEPSSEAAAVGLLSSSGGSYKGASAEQETFAPAPQAGLTGSSWAFASFPSPIPVSARRLLHIKTADMGRRSANYPVWAARIDQVVAGRLDRKGILHTTSYGRRQEYLSRSRWAAEGLLLTHDRDNLEQVVAEFKRRGPPCLLVSPAMVRGLSFEYDACRYSVIGKLPYPDSRDPLIQARKALDPLYVPNLVMKALEQEAGRDVRAADDWSEHFATDNSIVWFMKRYHHLATQPFLEAWGGTIAAIPDPPPLS